VHDVAEGGVGVQAAADERRAGVAQRTAQRRQRVDALRGAAHDRRRGLDERLIEVVHDLAALRRDLGHEPAGDVGRPVRDGIDQQELLLDSQGKVGL
jgi:hypothetical protein